MCLPAYSQGKSRQGERVPLKIKLKGKAAAKKAEPDVKLPFGLLDAASDVGLTMFAKTESKHKHGIDSDAEDSGIDSDDGSDSHGTAGDSDAEVAVIPSGMRLGIVALDITPSSRAKCWVCASKDCGGAENIPQGQARFWYRLKSANLEKSTHAKCILDQSFTTTGIARSCSEVHIRHSLQFLRSELEKDTVSDELKSILLSAITTLRSIPS